MPDQQDIDRWLSLIRGRYESYLKTSFYFRDPDLRASFDSALQSYELLKGPFPEARREFRTGATAGGACRGVLPGQQRRPDASSSAERAVLSPGERCPRRHAGQQRCGRDRHRER